MSSPPHTHPPYLIATRYPAALYLQCTNLYQISIFLLKLLKNKLKLLNFILLHCIIETKLDIQLNL